MKAAICEGDGKIVVKDVPDPVIQNPNEAIARVTHSCICGSDPSADAEPPHVRTRR